jgi:hypothetical protein
MNWLMISSKSIIQQKFIFVLLSFQFFFITQPDFCQELNLGGQFSAFGSTSRTQKEWNYKVGLRYIPHINFNLPINESQLLNSEVMLNVNFVSDFQTNNQSIKTYRAILRYSTERTETQIGLQKINFGSAQLLRPLMWFDKMDPRDPLKITEGVYGIRFKYNFLDNSALWLWSLIGNNEKKGIDILPSDKKIPEFGGRLQIPFLTGELAATFHTRKVNATLFNYRENRIALDGRWDVGIGLWFESVLQNNITNLHPYKYNSFFSFGTDYTFPIENGIYFMAEHLFTTFSNSILKADMTRNVSAVMFSYSTGLFDLISLHEFYDWFSKNLYHNLQFQRTYDNFIVNFTLFQYPEHSELVFLNNTTNILSGFGLQLMVIYNY